MDLANFMGFSKASISIAVNKLCREGYVAVGEDGRLSLTPPGRTAAETIYERHRFFEKKLTALGVSSEQAHEDACRLEHAISTESFEALRRDE